MTKKELDRTLKEIDPRTRENKFEILKLFRNIIGYVLLSQMIISIIWAYTKCAHPISFNCFVEKLLIPHPYVFVLAGLFGLYRWIETEILDQEFPDD